jgi:hypothetical protein
MLVSQGFFGGQGEMGRGQNQPKSTSLRRHFRLIFASLFTAFSPGFQSHHDLRFGHELEPVSRSSFQKYAFGSCLRFSKKHPI